MEGKITLTPTEVMNPNACEFGKWLLASGKPDLGESFADIDRLHRAFHLAASEVVRLKNAGDATAAEAMMSVTGQFTKASSALVQKLMAA
jgi:hypothetical protein